MYYNSRYYDPALGAFIGCPLGADTIVPRPGGTRTNLFDFNRYMYVRGRVFNFNDPTGHVTSKPDDHPDHQPYLGDLPDGLTIAELQEWISENNIPTTVGGQFGLDLSARMFVGVSVSFETGWMFNWYSGELVWDGVTSGGGVLGIGGDLTLGVHTGITSVAGASSIERSIEGYSTYASNGISTDTLVNLGGNTVIQQGVNGNKNSNFVTLEDLREPYIDPLFDRTVDSWSSNLTASLDPAPSIIDVESGRGVAKTHIVRSTNVYNPIVSLYQWMFGE